MKYIKDSARKGAIEGDVVDADFAANQDTIKEASFWLYVFTLYDTTITWKSTSVVVLSTTIAEFIALTEVVKESVWLKDSMEKFGIFQK